ncbi:unnamed protein product [Effrenium voratum]|nr:unnamed protein product [Effrenium voratum]
MEDRGGRPLHLQLCSDANYRLDSRRGKSGRVAGAANVGISMQKLCESQSWHEPGMDEGVLAEKGFDFRVLTFDIHCQRSYVQMCMQLFAVYSYSAYYAWFLVEAEASQERKPAKEAPSWFQRVSKTSTLKGSARVKNERVRFSFNWCRFPKTLAFSGFVT